MNPLVSIIIPTYNREWIIEDTLLSVISQTYTNWECIIVDDKSTDNTKEIVEKHSKKDDRFQFITKSDSDKKGASISRNIGLKYAKGQYIQFLDSDDLLANNKLEAQVNLLIKEDYKTIATCKWGEFVNTEDPVVLHENKEDYITFTNPLDYFNLIGKIGGFFPPINFLVSKELINFSGYWNENLTMNDDGEFFFRVISNANKIEFAKETYVLYRNNNSTNDNLSTLNSEEKARQLLRSWKLIETLYSAKFKDDNSPYLNKKKDSVYGTLKNTYPKIISENKYFFKEQLKKDTLYLKSTKLFKRVKNKLNFIWNKYKK